MMHVFAAKKVHASMTLEMHETETVRVDHVISRLHTVRSCMKEHTDTNEVSSLRQILFFRVEPVQPDEAHRFSAKTRVSEKRVLWVFGGCFRKEQI